MEKLLFMEISSLSSSSGALHPEIASVPDSPTAGTNTTPGNTEKPEGIPVADPISSSGGIINTQA
ncbi:hypothetical protein EHQ76_16565 [Leptospira barantonii]|uniref:Uncharacterized protein n=1 Tax=Leptospira barantonii TaxID=2023184 RepID=A0A5F2AZD5_9LEPT|nr:hypothetical protein [Leptospira barantonii]TGL95518.1 hypothetical protein EHQ76_16565 [Leptospira barantonii]